MAYRYDLYDSVRQIDAADWSSLHDAEDDPLMDRRFFVAVERSMADSCRLWHVVFRDPRERPVASACLCLYRLDLALVAGGWARKAVSLLARAVPRLTQVRLLCCGLPASGQDHLTLSPEADSVAVLRMLDQLVLQIAAEHGARCVAIGQSDAAKSPRLEGLKELGYSRFPMPPTNLAGAGHGDFEDYLSSLKCRKRRHVRRSQRKFGDSGFRVVHLTGGEGAGRIFSDEVYRLYEAVYERAPMRLAKMPAAFFREAAAQMPDRTAFTFVYEGDRVVAFSFSVFSDTIFRAMYAGFDYDLNPANDLYFNLMFHTLDNGYRLGASEIYMGQTSDTFKRRRLSCYQRPLFLYAKGTRPLASRIIRSRLSRIASARDDQDEPRAAESPEEE